MEENGLEKDMRLCKETLGSNSRVGSETICCPCRKIRVHVICLLFIYMFLYS